MIKAIHKCSDFLKHLWFKYWSYGCILSFKYLPCHLYYANYIMIVLSIMMQAEDLTVHASFILSTHSSVIWYNVMYMCISWKSSFLQCRPMNPLKLSLRKLGKHVKCISVRSGLLAILYILHGGVRWHIMCLYDFCVI